MPRLAVRSRMEAVLLAVVGAVLLPAVVGAGAGWAQDRAVPEPPVVVPGGVDDGQIRLDPAVQEPVDDMLTWVLSNGGDDALTFGLALHEVVAGGDRLELGAERDDLPLDADQVRLATGEQARVRLPVPADADGGALALVARTLDADPVTEVSALAIVGGDGSTVSPSVVHTDGAAGAVTVRLDSPAAALVDVAIRVRVWPGITAEERRLEGIVVPAGGRDLDVEVTGLALGRMTVEVAVSGRDGVEAETVWWWPREAVLGLATVLLLFAIGMIANSLRSRRRRRHTPDPSPPVT